MTMQEFIAGVDSLIHGELLPADLFKAAVDWLERAEAAGLDPQELRAAMQDRAEETIRDAHRALAVFRELE
jgi:hypothetical protein